MPGFAINENGLILADVTTANATSSKHGLLPKLENSGTKFLRDDGSWQTPSGGTVDTSLAGGRLTTESGVAVSTSDRTSQATLYYTPYLHGLISTYSGSAWSTSTFTEKSLSLTLTADKNYDVFIVDGTLALELSAAWTNDTTRADALTTQDGVYVKSGATTRRYLGTIRASGSNATEDSAAKRFVWNLYNQLPRPITKLETGNWNYTSATVRPLNNNTANRVQAVCGLAGAGSLMLRGEILIYVSNATTDSNGGVIGIDEDGTTGNDATLTVGAYQSVTTGAASTYSLSTACATLTKATPLGFHYWQATEGTLNAAHGTVTWYADTPNGGLHGWIFS